MRLGGEWSEFGVEAPAGLRDEVLLKVVAPVLDKAILPGLFLCELRRREDGRERTTVQVRTGAGDAGARRELVELLDVVPAPPDTVVSPLSRATGVPLAGGVMSGPALAPLTRNLLADVTPALLALVPGGRSIRLGGALDLMVAHLAALGAPVVPGAREVVPDLGGAPLGFLSFHSHAEAFIASSRDAAATRQALDLRYERVRATVTARVSALLADPAAAPAAAAWHAAVTVARPGADEAFRTGALSADDAVDTDPGAFVASAFHTELSAAPGFLRVLQTDPGFLGARLMTSLLYLSLANIGVALAERYFLCHAVSRACSELFGADPVAVLAKLARG